MTTADEETKTLLDIYPLIIKFLKTLPALQVTEYVTMKFVLFAGLKPGLAFKVYSGISFILFISYL